MTTTKKTIALAEVAEKGADADLLREMIQYVAQRMMDLDIESLCQATYGERTADRANSRNGYRDRRWDTRTGSVDLKIPKLRKGSCSQFISILRSEAQHSREHSRLMLAARVIRIQAELLWASSFGGCYSLSSPFLS
jgi:transposase-like protein